MLSGKTTHSMIALAALALVLGIATAGLALLGYRAAQAWRGSAGMLVENRTEEIATLLVSAITKDMRGVQESILIPMQPRVLAEARPFELSDTFLRAFAQFPYPESFFVWKSKAESSTAMLFNRADRPPPWQKEMTGSTFPVIVDLQSHIADRLAGQCREYAVPAAEFALFETVIGEESYQVVARLFYDEPSHGPVGVVGFTVNLKWVRQHYFSELIDQIQRLAGRAREGGVALTISDGHGKDVVDGAARKSKGPVREKHFPFLFFDNSTVSIGALTHISPQQWTARVYGADDPVLEAADNGANRTLILIAVTTAVSIMGLLLATRSLRAKFELVAMKEDFVAAVTHELKTPLAGIGLLGDTLAKGRYTSDQAITEYGVLLSRETSRLKRIVENLLTFSRVNDGKAAYMMETIDIRDVVAEALARFKLQICEGAFDVECHMSNEACNITVDRKAIIQVLENLIDNAIKYSDQARKIEIRVLTKQRSVMLSIIDSGKGILQDDLPHVFTKFYRGKNAGLDGSGLGLSVVQKVVEDHGGSVVIESVPECGTSVTITFPS
jgi:signal transduction histidine kinase